MPGLLAGHFVLRDYIALQNEANDIPMRFQNAHWAESDILALRKRLTRINF
jgi:hypothetical protein